MKRSVHLVPPSIYLVYQLGIQGCVPCIYDCLDPLTHGINALIYFPQTRRIYISKADNIIDKLNEIHYKSNIYSKMIIQNHAPHLNSSITRRLPPTYPHITDNYCTQSPLHLQ
eukprot:Gb_33305 [translate_table: standard]